MPEGRPHTQAKVTPHGPGDTWLYLLQSLASFGCALPAFWCIRVGPNLPLEPLWPRTVGGVPGAQLLSL